MKEITTSIRDLIIQLHQRNAQQADVLANEVTQQLEAMRPAIAQVDSRFELTMAAIGEVRHLMAEKDFRGAASAAREAAKEWRSNAEPVA